MNRRFKTLKTLVATLGATVTILTATAACADVKINPGPHKDGTLVRDNVRGQVWCEIVPMVGTPPNAVMHIYNSTFAENCTEERTTNFDTTKMAADLGVPKVIVNPGRYWVFDRVTIYNAGELVDFNGIKAHWAATMTPQDVSNIVGSKPWTPGKIKRDTEWFYKKSKPVYLLRTPEGKVWVLQVFSKAKDPTMSLETLDQLASKLDLPAGWKFEKRILDNDLSLQPRWSDGEAYIMRDNLGNTYMGCGFDKSCSYIP